MRNNTYTDPVTGLEYEKKPYDYLDACYKCAGAGDVELCERLPCIVSGYQSYIFKLIPTEGEAK